MPMPGRNGHLQDGGWQMSTTPAGTTGNTGVLGSLSQDWIVTDRLGNTPAEYVATNTITFVNEFSSGGYTNYIAYIDKDGNTTSGAYTTNASSSAYRYGFNGKENDKDISEGGQDYTGRIYDGRLGRWYSVDVKYSKYPYLTPYNHTANNPILFKDFNGNDFVIVTTDLNATTWNNFCSVVNSRFYDCLDISRTDIDKNDLKNYGTNYMKDKPLLCTEKSYAKVSFTINEKALNEKIKNDPKNSNLTADEITNKVSELKNEIETSMGYRVLNSIQSKPSATSGVYDLSSSISFGGGNLGYRTYGINTSVAKDWNNIANIGFCVILHEVIEGFIMQNLNTDFAFAPETKFKEKTIQREWFSSSTRRNYAFSHCTALEFVGQDMGGIMSTSSTLSKGGGSPYFYYFRVYTLSNGKYYKTEWTYWKKSSDDGGDVIPGSLSKKETTPSSYQEMYNDCQENKPN